MLVSLHTVIYISWLASKAYCKVETANNISSILLLSKEMLTATPENDGFHWRKYGEKKILNATFPRYDSLKEFPSLSN
jgi:hypothetical protein